MPATSGSPTQIATSVSTPEDLSGTPDNGFKEGDLAYVSSLWPNASFRLRRNAPPLGADNVSAIKTFSGNGYWEVFAQGSAIVTLANIATLEALDDSAMGEGSIVYVASVRSYWQKFTREAVTIDGITSVPTKSSDGAWIRLAVPSQTWAATTSWYISPTSGNDENAGNVAGAPLKTAAELSRRLRFLNRATSYTIQIEDDVPSKDSLFLKADLLCSGARPALYIKGKRNIVGNGTLSAGNTSDPQANIVTYPAGRQASITDNAGRVWAKGQVVYFTSGNANGGCCFVTRDLTGGVARVGQPFLTTTADNAMTSVLSSANSPTNGTTYDIVEYTKWNASIYINADATIYISRLDFNEGTASFDATAFSMRFRECTFSKGFSVWNTGQVVGNLQTTGCCIGTGISGFRTTLSGVSPLQYFQNTVFIYNRLAPTSKNVFFDGCTFQGDSDYTISPPFVGSLGSLDVGYNLTQPTLPTFVGLRNVNAFWDWGVGIGGGAITVMYGAKVAMLNNLSGPENFLMGSGGNIGVQAISGGEFTYPPAINATYVPRLIGNTMDLLIDNLDGAADGNAKSPIPALVPNAVVPNTLTLRLANGAGWAKWEASFTRRLLSHWTRSAITAWPYG